MVPGSMAYAMAPRNPWGFPQLSQGDKSVLGGSNKSSAMVSQPSKREATMPGTPQMQHTGEEGPAEQVTGHDTCCTCIVVLVP